MRYERPHGHVGGSGAMERALRQPTLNVVPTGAPQTPMLGAPARAATPLQLPRLGPFTEPEDIADLRGSLLSLSGRSITGQRLVVRAGAST